MVRATVSSGGGWSVCAGPGTQLSPHRLHPGRESREVSGRQPGTFRRIRACRSASPCCLGCAREGKLAARSGGGPSSSGPRILIRLGTASALLRPADFPLASLNVGPRGANLARHVREELGLDPPLGTLGEVPLLVLLNLRLPPLPLLGAQRLPPTGHLARDVSGVARGIRPEEPPVRRHQGVYPSVGLLEQLPPHILREARVGRLGGAGVFDRCWRSLQLPRLFPLFHLPLQENVSHQQDRHAGLAVSQRGPPARGPPGLTDWRPPPEASCRRPWRRRRRPQRQCRTWAAGR